MPRAKGRDGGGGDGPNSQDHGCVAAAAHMCRHSAQGRNIRQADSQVRPGRHWSHQPVALPRALASRDATKARYGAVCAECESEFPPRTHKPLRGDWCCVVPAADAGPDPAATKTAAVTMSSQAAHKRLGERLATRFSKVQHAFRVFDDNKNGSVSHTHASTHAHTHDTRTTAGPGLTT